MQAALTKIAVRELLSYREGFGAATTGGLDGSIYTVTNLNDSGPGSLRYGASSSTPSWIVFSPTITGGTINLSSSIYLGANKTIDGRGSGITIAGHGLVAGGNWGAGNDIIAGLAIRNIVNPSEDSISIYGVTNVWVYRASLSGQGGDGLLDISDGAGNVTVGSSRFSDHNGAMIVNSYPTSPDPNNPNGEILNGHQLDNYNRDKNVHVTLHDSVFDGIFQREPRAVFGQVHAYNNIFKDWGAYAVGSSFRAQTLLEGNVFDSHGPYGNKAIVTQVGIDPEPGFVRATDNLFLGTASGASSGAGNVFVTPYSYSYEHPSVGMEARLLQQAGVEGNDTLGWTVLKIEEQVAVNYVAFFNRAPDQAGFQFWVGEFNHGLATHESSELFADIASSFGVSNEAKVLYPFLANPYGASNSQIGAFIDSVYGHLYGRHVDAAGLAYWTNEIRATLQAGQFVGSVLTDIIGGTQAGADLWALSDKIEVALIEIS